MFTLRESAALLRAAGTVDGLAAIGRAIGFDGDAALDAHALISLGVDHSLADVRLMRGAGSLRAILFESRPGSGRSDLARTAARLGARAPHVLWVLMAVEREANRVFIAASTPSKRGVKVAALIADRARVMDSDAETLRMLVAGRTPDDLATHGRFIEILGRDALSRQFFRNLEACVNDLAHSARTGPIEARREIALLYASRLLFLGFLESKGWLDDDATFLTRTFDRSMASGGQFHERVMLPLFFGTLNTPVRRRASRARAFGRVPFLNGGLFTPTRVERGLRSLRFTDEACGRFFGELLSRYRFTALEETASFEEAAVDPEMLGRTFECLMAADSRRAAGAFYTPHELVERVTQCGLDAVLGDLPGARSLESLAALRVLDPACGSGAFLVHVLDRLAELRQIAGDDRPSEFIRREVLARSIFGVDINPTAVWLCQLRLWLSLVIDSAGPCESVTPLPNLDRNVRVGDSLSGSAFGEVRITGGPALRRLRERYARSTGARKSTLARMLDREERRLVLASAASELESVSQSRRDLVSVRRGRDLFGGRYQPTREEARQAEVLRDRSLALRRRIRAARRGESLPFAFPAHFADVAASGGFSLIVGNPPWVRPHHVDAETRDALRQSFVVARGASWSAGATAAGAGKGFSSQVDLAAIFVERSLRLLAPEGALSLLLPSKLWRSLSGGGLRALIASDTHIVRVEDYADVPAAFDAAVYPGLLVASRDRRGPSSGIAIAILHRARHATTWTSPLESLAWDASTGAPWILCPADVRVAFDQVRLRGLAMSESAFGRPLLGVKCGLNEAFIVRAQPDAKGHSTIVAANGREAIVESSALRPVLRGERVRPWSVGGADDRIVWTHGRDGNPLTTLPEGVARWLAPYRRALSTRTDARRAERWWSVFRTDGASSDTPRVVWADIGRSVRAAVLAAGDPTIPLNTCYIARCPTYEDALALSVVLNSQLATAWLSVIAEPARGGYRRYLGWTMSLFPLPAPWSLCRGPLAAVGERAMRSPDAVTPAELLSVVVDAYGIRRRDLDPLLAWAAE